MKTSKPLTREAALLKMASLCARSEQSPFEIERKLKLKGMSEEDVREVIGELRARGFVDERRYARSFARDKVRFAGWGRLKIRAALAAKRIPSAIAAEGIAAIEPKDYSDALKRVASAAARNLDFSNQVHKGKFLRSLASRGFEMDLAMKVLNFIESKQNER